MPWHDKRTWVVHPAESAEWLAEKLVGHTWCSCQGWSLEGYLFLNDQTCEDGAFEIAIVKPPPEDVIGGKWRQVESVTFGWLLDQPPGGWPDRYNLDLALKGAQVAALGYITKAVAGRYDHVRTARFIPPCQIETPEQHGRCRHCA